MLSLCCIFKCLNPVTVFILRDFELPISGGFYLKGPSDYKNLDNIVNVLLCFRSS